MAVITTAEKDLLQGQKHKTRLFCSPLVPDTLWTAKINDPTIEIGETDIAFDFGSGLSFSHVRVQSEVWIGTEAEKHDIGRGRVRGTTSADNGATGTINIAPNSFQLVDNLWLTFKFDFPLKPKYSYVDPNTEEFFKDYDRSYSFENSTPPPVVIAGPHQANFIDESLGHWEKTVDLSFSYAIAEGATISSYGMEVLAIPGNAFTTSFDTNTGLGWIRFEDPGNYWVKYTVTDSNGIGQQSWRWYRVCEDDPTSAHYPLTNFQLNLSGGWDGAGYQAGITAREGFAVGEFPDRALTVVWQDSYYDGTRQLISRLPNEATNVFTGYVISSDDTYDLEEGIADADFALQSVTGRLQNLYGFSLTLRATPDTVDEWYLFEEWMTTGVAVHHLLRWQTTALETTDVFGLRDDTLKRVGAMTQEGTIHGMAHTLCWEQGVRTKLVSDMGGRMHMTPDHQLLTDSERAGLNEVMAIEEADRSGPITIHRRQTRAAPLVTVSGVHFDGTFNEGDETDPNVSAYCAQGPGAFAHDDGPAPTSLDNQLFTSQAHANEIAGRLDAQVNNPIGRVDVEFHGHYLSVLEFAYEDYYTLTLQAGDTPRGLWVGEKKLFLREVTLQADEYGALSVSAGFEPEAEGHDGVETVCPGLPELGGIPEPPPIELALPGGLITGSSIYYKGPQSTDWVLRLIEDVLDVTADPFWTSRQASTASDDSIQWRCGSGYIKRTTDNWGTEESDVTPTGPIDGVAVANIDFVDIEGSPFSQGRFVCVGRHFNGATWQSWLFLTEDDGTSWTHTALGSTLGDVNGFSNLDSAEVFELIWNGESIEEPVVCRMTDSKFAVVYGFGGDETVNEARKLYARVGTIDSSGSITLHPQTTVYNGTANFKVVFSTTEAVGMSDDKVMVACRIVTQENSGDPEVADLVLIPCYLDATRVQLTSGAPHKFEADLPSNTTTARIHKLVRLDSNDGVVMYNTSEATVKYYFRRFTHALSVADAGAPSSAFDVGFSQAGFEDCIALTSGRLIAGYHNQADDDKYYGFIVDKSGDIFTLGSAQELLPVTSVPRTSLGRQSDTHFVTVDDDVRSFEVSGSTITGGTAVDLRSDAADPDVWAHNIHNPQDDEVIIVYQYNTNTLRAVDFTFSGTTATRGTDQQIFNFDNFNAHSALGDGASTEAVETVLLGNNIFATSFEIQRTFSGDPTYGNNQVNWFGVHTADFDRAAGSGGAARVHGLDISKGIGMFAYITQDDGSNLVIEQYSLPDLSLVDNATLGGATGAEVDAGTYAAYPLCVFGFEGAVYVFGRMNDPQGLGNPTQIALFDGFSWSSVEGGWGSDVCGAMIQEGAGTLSAVRNISGSAAKLYRGDETGLSLKCTLPFTAGVNPEAIAVSYFTGDLFLGADTSQETMILQVQPPFSVSDIVDLTFDHPTDEGINAVVLL